MSDSSFSLLDNLSWTSDSLLEIKTLELDNFSLTLGSASSDLKIIEPLILDHSDEKLISGEADLEFSGLLNISLGELSSSNGKIQLEQGVVLSGGALTVPNSTLVIGNQFSKSGGSVNLAGTNLQLYSDLSLTSNSLISIQSLELNQKKLTLSDGESDLEVQSLLEIDDVNEGLITGDADLELKQGISISAGEVTSTAGTVAINGTSSLSSGTLSISSGTLALGGSFEKSGGTLSLSDSSFSLLSNLTWTSDSLLEIKTLDLGNNSLTLNSASSDLRINNSLTLDHENEKLICGNADLEFTGLLNISLGEVSSSNGKIQLEQGIILSGGNFEAVNSTLVVGNQFNKSGGSVDFGGTTLKLFSDLSLTSNTLPPLLISKLSFASLDLNQKKLTLSGAESDLEVQNQVVIDHADEGLITGDADLDLKQGLRISAGEVTSTAGTVSINGASSLSNGTLSVFSGTLALGGSFEKNGGHFSLSDSALRLLDNLTWTSDSLLELPELDLDNYSLTLGSDSSDLKVNNDLIMDHDNEKLISGNADLEFSGMLSISEGEISSTGGSISMSKSFNLSGGTLSISSGTFSLGGVFNKNGGNLFLNDTTLSLLSDLQWSSDTLLEIKELQLNDKTLNLVDQFSDLKIISPLTLDHSDEKLISGPADLEFSGLVIISAGELSSNGGVVIFDQGLNQSGGKLKYLTAVFFSVWKPRERCHSFKQEENSLRIQLHSNCRMI